MVFRTVLCLSVCVLYILYAGRDLVCQGISLDRTFSDDEDEQPRRKRKLLHTLSPESCERE